MFLLLLLSAGFGLTVRSSAALAPPPALRAADSLTTDCYNWPSTEFSTENYAQISAGLRAGSKAIDFALSDAGGIVYHLSQLLQTRPVVLQFCTYTCPVYEGNVQASSSLAEMYGEQVWFLYIYGPEAHPESPYVSPYSGEVWMKSNYSILPQAYTFPDRMSFAQRCVVGEECPVIAQEWIMLVDALPGANHSGNNPVWCTYGPSPNGGYLIDQQGNINVSQPWIDLQEMNTALAQLLLSKNVQQSKQ